MILTARALNRTVLARQLLLARARIPLGRALERVAGLQAQYAPSPYIRLWSMLRDFELGDLTRALERRRAVQGTLMRSTIHVVSPRDYWSFAAGVGPSRERWWVATHGREHRDADLRVIAAELRRELAGRTWHRKELDALLRGKGSTVWTGAWVELVREPPSGTWNRRRADLYRLAAEWLRPANVAEDDGLEHLLRRYLAAFGPGTLADAAKWAGVDRASLVPIAERIRLRLVRDEDGKELVDLPRAPIQRGRDTCAAAVSRNLGRGAPRPRPTHADPPRAVSPARLLHEDAAIVPDVPGRRLGCRHLEGRPGRNEGDASRRAVRAAPARRARRRARRGRRTRAVPRARRSVVRRPGQSLKSVSSGSRSPRSTSRSTSTHPSPRASQSVDACGLTFCAARIPRQPTRSGSGRITSR